MHLLLHTVVFVAASCGGYVFTATDVCGICVLVASGCGTCVFNATYCGVHMFVAAITVVATICIYRCILWYLFVCSCCSCGSYHIARYCGVCVFVTACCGSCVLIATCGGVFAGACCEARCFGVLHRSAYCGSCEFTVILTVLTQCGVFLLGYLCVCSC